MKMELFVADGDGKNQKQITSFGCASFAPTFTPDGKKILFASNKHKCDGRDFELYLINPDGSGLEQVTEFGGFTSFPEFSPDGKKLVFASSYKATGRYEFNIFHGGLETMKLLRSVFLLTLAATLVSAQPKGPETPRKKRVLAIGAVEGYQHDTVSNGLATIWKLGHDSGLWDTFIKTDTELLTKKKLTKNAKNIDYFDAIFLYTTG
jgi:dipeptidyl aminopeptidase/acylaminoacyl peptidase